jgi:hypothetical protein
MTSVASTCLWAVTRRPGCRYNSEAAGCRSARLLRSDGCLAGAQARGIGATFLLETFALPEHSMLGHRYVIRLLFAKRKRKE